MPAPRCTGPHTSTRAGETASIARWTAPEVGFPGFPGVLAASTNSTTAALMECRSGAAPAAQVGQKFCRGQRVEDIFFRSPALACGGHGEGKIQEPVCIVGVHADDQFNP